jgi:hypothetical protein
MTPSPLRKSEKRPMLIACFLFRDAPLGEIVAGELPAPIPHRRANVVPAPPKMRRSCPLLLS